MLRILGSNKRFCDGISRRDLMHIGALAPFGLTLANPIEASATKMETGSFGKAKRCLLLYLWGSPSQMDTFDPKPDAPVEVRGELGSIPSIIPGVRVGEIFPRIAQLLNRARCCVRSTMHTPCTGPPLLSVECHRPTSPWKATRVTRDTGRSSAQSSIISANGPCETACSAAKFRPIIPLRLEAWPL